MSVLDHFNTKLFSEIEALSKKHGLQIFKKLKKEKDLSNAISIVTEAHFGLFFDNKCTRLVYDQKIFPSSKRKPDWFININGQDIIVEVVLINPSEEDKYKIDMDRSAILNSQKDYPGIPMKVNFHATTIKPEKLYGNNGSLQVKTKKYGELVESSNYAFIICISADVLSGLDAIHLFNSLYGYPVEIVGEHNFDDYCIGVSCHDLSNALYYENEQIKKNLSGVLLKAQDDYIYFHNFFCGNRLNEDNTEWLRQLQFNA